MSFVRLAQFGAERNTIQDLQLYTSTNMIVSTSKTRTGVNAYRMGTSNAAFGIDAGRSLTSVRIGYWINHVGLAAAVVPIFVLTNGTDPSYSPAIFVMWVETGSQLEIRRRPTYNTWQTLASATVPASLAEQNTWIHLGLTWKIGEVDGYMTTWIGGSPVLQYTGDTRPSAAQDNTTEGRETQIFGTGAQQLMVAGRIGPIDTAWTSYAYLDDLYFDEAIGEADQPVPNRRFLWTMPNGAANPAQYTPVGAASNLEAIDDNPPDNDTTYNQALAAGLRDLYPMADVTIPGEHRIVSVIPAAAAANQDSEIPSTLKMILKDGADESQSAELQPGMSYSPATFARITQHPSGAAWTEANLNTTEMGYESAGTF